MIYDANSAFSPDQYVLNVCPTATRLQCGATLPRPVYESSFSTSKALYQTSRNAAACCRFLSISRYSRPDGGSYVEHDDIVKRHYV